MEEWQTILGKIPSKSNCYRIITLNGHGSLAKTKDIKDYEKSFYLQCDKYRNKDIQGLFEIEFNVYNESQRADLDNAAKILMDMLEVCKAIKNDRNCVKIIAQKFIDKNNPRVEFKIKEV